MPLTSLSVPVILIALIGLALYRGLRLAERWRIGRPRAIRAAPGRI